MSSRRISAVLAVLCMLIPLLTGSLTTNTQDDDPSGLAPEDIWSEDYANHVHPWGGNDRIQFKQYHDYFTMKDRMMELSEKNYVYQDQSVNIISFHEGLNGGTNARGVDMTLNNYEGHFYSHASPWVKITGGGEELNGVDGGECNDFVGDCGNYAEIPDVQMIGNFHAREWMSYEVPMMFLETCLLYTSPSPRDQRGSRMPSSA